MEGGAAKLVELSEEHEPKHNHEKFKNLKQDYKKLNNHNSRSGPHLRTPPTYVISQIWIHFPELWDAVDRNVG